MAGADRFKRFAGANGVETTLKTSSVRGGAFAMAGEAIDFVIRLASIVVLARLLTPDNFGLIGMVTVITSIAERFQDLGLTSATVQRKDITHEQVSTLFWVNTGVGALLALAVTAMAYPLTSFYGEPRLLYITLAVACSFLFSGAAVQHLALLRRQMQFARIGAVQVAANAASLALAVWLAMHGFGYWALVAREVSRPVFLASGVWAASGWLPGRFSWTADVRSMLRFGGDLTFTNIVYFVSASLDQILIGKLFGPATLGIYRQGYSLVLAPITQLTFPVTVVAESALSRLQDDAERYRRYYRKLLSALSMATMPLLVLMAVHAEDVIRVSLGPAWIEAAPVFRIMAVAAFIRPAATTLGPVMITCGHTRTVVWMGLLTAVALAVFVVAGAPWGPTGVASAHVWTAYVLLLPKLYWSVRGTPVTMRLFFAALARPFAASMLMAGVVATLRLTRPSDTPLENLFVGALAGAAVYLVVWLATPAGRTELMELIADLGGSFGLARPLGSPAANVVTQTR